MVEYSLCNDSILTAKGPGFDHQHLHSFLPNFGRFAWVLGRGNDEFANGEGMQGLHHLCLEIQSLQYIFESYSSQ